MKKIISNSLEARKKSRSINKTLSKSRLPTKYKGRTMKTIKKNMSSWRHNFSRLRNRVLNIKIPSITWKGSSMMSKTLIKMKYRGWRPWLNKKQRIKTKMPQIRNPLQKQLRSKNISYQRRRLSTTIWLGICNLKSAL